MKKMMKYAELFLAVGLLTACGDDSESKVKVEEGADTSSVNILALEGEFDKLPESDLVSKTTKKAVEKVEAMKEENYEAATKAVEKAGLKVDNATTLDEVVETIGKETKGLKDETKFDYLYGYVANDLKLTDEEIEEDGYFLLEDVSLSKYESASVADLLTLSSIALVVLENSEDKAIKQVALPAYELYYGLGTGEFQLESDEAMAKIQELNNQLEIYKNSFN